jgi:acyl-CoA thioesterase I
LLGFYTMNNLFFPLATIFFFALNCRHQPVENLLPTPTPEIVDYLALGDSYTIGESVALARNFPNQLADSLRSEGFQVPTVRIIAKTGWRTDQLQAAIADADDLKDSTFSIVTLLIGVNNQYQNTNFSLYKPQFQDLLKTAIKRAGGRKNRVLVVSIPDWAYTAYGQHYTASPAVISAQIDGYNKANKMIADSVGVRYVNITDISRRGLAMPELVAPDDLHPSDQQYSEWVGEMLPVVLEMLR